MFIRPNFHFRLSGLMNDITNYLSMNNVPVNVLLCVVYNLVMVYNQGVLVMVWRHL